MAELDQDAPGEKRLAAIADLDGDDKELKTHLAAHRALAALLVPDLDVARREIKLLREIAPESAMTMAIEVNLAVQMERINTVAGRSLDAASLIKATWDGLKLRDRLLEQKRFTEAGRVLMLAADALCLLGERERAADLLREADPAELAASQIAEVLAAAAAGRALDFRLARELLEGAQESAGTRLLNAEIAEEIGNAEERAAGLETLEAMVAEGGPNAAEAAFIRLAANLGPRPTEWCQAAADYLREHGHIKAAVTGEAAYVVKRHMDFEKAEALLAPYRKEIWARAAWLRMEVKHGRWAPMKEAADKLLELGPSQQLQLEAGAAYAKSGHFDDAQKVLARLARDPGAPTPTRSGAFRLLLRVVMNERQDWDQAATLHSEWIEIDPSNPDASAMIVRIANRRLQARRRRAAGQ